MSEMKHTSEVPDFSGATKEECWKQEVAKKDRLQEEQIYNILETGNLTISKLQKRIADLEKKLEEKEKEINTLMKRTD